MDWLERIIAFAVGVGGGVLGLYFWGRVKMSGVRKQERIDVAEAVDQEAAIRDREIRRIELRHEDEIKRQESRHLRQIEELVTSAKDRAVEVDLQFKQLKTTIAAVNEELRAVHAESKENERRASVLKVQNETQEFHIKLLKAEVLSLREMVVDLSRRAGLPIPLAPLLPEATSPVAGNQPESGPGPT